MIVKNTLSVTASNFSLIFKIMIFALVLVLIFAAVFTGVLSPLFQSLGEALDIQPAIDGTAPPIGDRPITENTSSLADLIKNLGESLSNFMKANSNALWFAFGVSILTIFFIRFFLGLLLVPSAKYLSNKMTTGFSEGLWRTFLSSVKNSVALSFFSTLIFIVFDVGLTCLTVYLAFLLGKSIGIFAVYIAVIVLIVLFSFRTALTAMWLPRIAMRGEKPVAALLQTLRDTKKTFVKCFTGCLAIWISVFLTTAATFVFTLGLSFVIIIPMGIVLYIAMTHVQFCHFYKQNYFKDEHNAVKVTEDNLTVSE